MGLAVFVLMVAVLALWNGLMKLDRKLDSSEASRLGEKEDVRAELARLRRQLADVRAGSADHRGDRPAPALPATTQMSPAEPTPLAPAPAEAPEAVQAPAADTGALATVRGTAGAPPTSQSADAPLSEPEAPAPVPSPATTPSEAEGWEVTVGTSWLNKIGVLVTVIGIALLVGYSMTNVGPLGRVMLGYALSVAMLGAGVLFERRDTYRTYGYGLVAGGWAGAYFTTYAMRAVPAAQIMTSDVVGTSCLALVAAGMVGHALRYRSQTVTGLAYVVAFVTLMLTPLTTFSLVAALPLAVSVLFVSQRFGWAATSVLGVASTYVIFALRTQPEGGNLDPYALPPYLLLAAYWLTFEAADIIVQRRRDPDAPEPAPLFALNAAGFLAAGLMHLPADVTTVTRFVTASAAAYGLSAVVRGRLIGLHPGETGKVTTFTTTHGAVALTALLALWSVDLRFSGVRETFGLLLMAEVLFASGLALKDAHIRHMAGVAAGAATGHLLYLAGMAGGVITPALAFPAGWTIAAVALAAAWYGHREWLRARGLEPQAIEYAYTWAATWLVVIVLVREFELVRAGLAALVFAAALVEAGIHRRPELRWQGYGVGVGAALSLFLIFIADLDTSPTDVWVVLPVAAALGYVMALRLARQTDEAAGRGRRVSAGLAATIGTAFVALLLNETLPAEFVGPAWSVLAMVLLIIGLRRSVLLLRWHAYGLLVFGPGFAFGLIMRPADATTAQLVGALASLGLAYAGSLVARGAVGTEDPTSVASQAESGARLTLSVFATMQLTALIALEAPENAVTLLWGLEGLALLAAGFPTRERVLRLSGLGVLLLCILKLFVFDIWELEALPRIVSFVVLGLVLLGVSLTYTRFKDQLKQYL